MKTRSQLAGLRAGSAGLALFAFSLSGCGGSGPAQAEKPAAPAGPPTIDVVRIVEQPVNVTLSMPGELQPYQTVAIYPKVTGFVKTIRVDRGSRVRTGEPMAELEAPELVAQRAEAQSKVQAAEAQLAVARSKATISCSRRRPWKPARARLPRRSRPSKPRARR
jgi:membrane fusion protein (multidrug efflux system)